MLWHLVKWFNVATTDHLEVTDELPYFIIFALSFLPIIVYFICTVLFNIEKSISYYYKLEMFMLVLLVTAGHCYYYIFYDMALFSASEYTKFFLIFSIIGIPVIYVSDLIFSKLKKESSLSFKGTVVICLFVAFFLICLTPLVHKIYYAKRLHQLEETFSGVDSDKITEDDDIIISLIDSSYDPMIRPLYRSPGAYNNFLYIKNKGNSTYQGSIYLTLINENNREFKVKLLEDVEVPAHSTQQLIDTEEKNMPDEWTKRSFKTKQQVETFNAVISNN